MTFCLGMRVSDGLVGIADTRVTTGTECITARKVTVHHMGDRSFFLMTSGLRSVRDKALTYFEEALDTLEAPFTRLYQAVNLFAAQVRSVAEEDKRALEESHFRFDLHALVGGRLEDDHEHKLYLLYPQGNWVDIGPGTPYCVIGEKGYGKPILDRTLKFDDSMRLALKVGCLAFDSTRISAANVDFPIDVVIYNNKTRKIAQHRYEKQDLAEMSGWWQERLRQSLTELPSECLDVVFSAPDPPKGTETIPIHQAEG